MRRLLVVTWLTILWVVMWRDLSVANVVSGIVVGSLAEVARPWHALQRDVHHRVRPVALAKFAVYFLWKLVEANVVLAREVLTPRNVIQTGVIEVPLGPNSDLVVAVVANAISLTPGTLTLEVRRLETPTLYVHVLHLHDIEAARADVHRLTRMVDAALPSVTDPADGSDAGSEEGTR